MSTEVILKKKKETIWYGAIIPSGYMKKITVDDIDEIINDIEDSIKRCEKEIAVYGGYTPSGMDDLIEVQKRIQDTLEYLTDNIRLLSLWNNIKSNIEDGWVFEVYY
jgi:hypothetical protein